MCKRRALFDLPTFKLKEELFVSPNLQLHHPTPFDRYCDEINACFSKKWHPTAKHIEYLDIFSICRWKELPDSTKKTHTLGYCSACYNAYPPLQAAFPGEPLYEPQVVVMLPPSTTEKSLARNVLAELNPKWESRFSHTFTEALTTRI